MNRPGKNRVYIIVAVAALLASAISQAQLDVGGVTGDLGRLPTDLKVDDRLQRDTERLRRKVEPVVDETLATVENGVVVGSNAIVSATGALRSFTADIDPNGAIVEQDVIVALVNSGEYAQLMQSGLELLGEKPLSSLGLTMVTLRVRPGTTLADSVARLRADNPDVAIDFNHLFRFATESSTTDAGDAQEQPAVVRDPGQLQIGVIDSAVQNGHRALRNSEVTARDFVAHDALRPLTHGTAISSLLAKSSNDNVHVHSASVFFQLPGQAPGATAESIVAALDWLVSENVDVINMSLAGPGNALLQTAVAAMQDKGPLIVAAVGNNGPSSEPLYPAAYDGPIGVTAVDNDDRVFRYANRGDYVDFAARGVNVKVADSETGGYRIESGTSMATPHIAVVVAAMLRESGIERDAVTSWLMSSARDLGRRGHDSTYGYGLVTRPPDIVSAN